MKRKLSTGILAGGKSSRMGQNKALLTMNNRQFIDIIASELSVFDETLISSDCKGKYEEVLKDAKIVVDEHKEIGPIEGIYQLIKNASNEYVFICGADMPFVKKELVMYMAEYISSDYDCYVIMDDEHIHPLCAIYSKAMLPVIEKLICDGNYRLLGILNNSRCKYIKLNTSCFSKKIVKNINTKDEYRKAVCPVIFAVSAVKNSGKTGLIVKLINEFIGEDYKVAVIKHDGHDYIMDYEGTDTQRFRGAGAKHSAIFSNTQYSINSVGHTTVEEMIGRMEDVDIIILEGMKESAYPKVEIVRSDISNKCVCDTNSLICVATDVVSGDDVKCPVYGLDDVSGIFLCIKLFFGLE